MYQQTFALLGAILTAVVVIKVVGFWSCLNQARRFAASSPIPYITVYWYRESGTFWLFSPWFAPILEKLPFRLGHWVHYKKRDFSWAHKGKLPREELGSDVFWTAAVDGCLLHVSDADVVSEIVHRWRDFPKAEKYYWDLMWFGDNVITTEGADWQRHRKVTGPSFNERNSSLVFQESLTQAKAMLASFTHEADGNASRAGEEPVIEDLIFWLKAIALNVLSGAAFNLHIPWPTNSVVGFDVHQELGEQDDESDTEFPAEPKAHLMTWQHCMNQIMENFYFLIGMSDWILEHSPWKFMRTLPAAYSEFMDYIQEMIEDAVRVEYGTDGSGKSASDSSDSEKEAVHTPKGSSSSTSSKSSPFRRNDLLSTILRANKNQQLDDLEIVGNICILLIAGHETSASVLETALILLATEPEFQQSIQDEIDSIWVAKKPGEDLTYEDYPKMRTIMALMLETLRVYPPIINLFKSTTDNPQTLTYRSQPLPLPPDTTIFLEAVSLHRNPKYWSPSPDTFLPSRWLKGPSYTPGTNTLPESPAHSNLLCPRKGSYIPFGAGMRSCLGKKFAQVEFCTIVAVLLKECSIELVPDLKGKGREWEEKRREALECLDRRRTILALRMLGKVRVRFVRRGAESFPPRKGNSVE